MYIYKIQNNIDSKCYIGQTANFKRRMNSHKTSKATDYLHNAIRKHGWDNFVIRVIHECASDVVDIFELLYQELWESHYTQNGYNIVIGGQGLRKHSEESKQKNREAHLGKEHSEETKRKMSEAHEGKICKPHSEETKQKISDANKGKTFSKEYRKKLSDANKGKTFSKEYRKKLSDGAKRMWGRRKIGQPRVLEQ